ncbi:MAG: carbon storage regulator, partial [Gemmataceae bacterium]|nr:carbon storage regulator [Gemmataceae bacterium]
MLVLSRRPEQRIVFPSLGISVEVLQIKGNTIRLGIQAPPEVSVMRQELIGTGQAAVSSPAKRTHAMRGELNTAQRLSGKNLRVFRVWPAVRQLPGNGTS